MVHYGEVNTHLFFLFCLFKELLENVCLFFGIVIFIVGFFYGDILKFIGGFPVIQKLKKKWEGFWWFVKKKLYRYPKFLFKFYSLTIMR